MTQAAASARQNGTVAARYLPQSLSFTHAVFAAALLVRLISLARLSASAVLLPTSGDMRFYDEWAQRIVHGQLTDHLAFYGLPLYAYWLAFLYKIFGPTPFVAIFVQAIAEAGTATLIYKLGAAVFNRDSTGSRHAQAIGAVAALGWIFYVPAEAYSAVLMPTSVGVFVFWFVVWQVVRLQSLSPSRCFAVGLLAGVLAMAVASILFVVPLVLASLFRKAMSRQHRLLAAAALLLGVTLGTAPASLHNRFAARDPVFLSAHSGVNFWIGNNAEATGYPHFPGLRAGQADMLEDSISVAQSEAGRPLKRSEVSAYWSRKARLFIAEQPLQWARLMALKLRKFWNAFEYDDVAVIAQLRHGGVIFPGLRFGVVAALALPGMFMAVRRLPAARWVAAAVLLQMISVVLMFVTERYRLAAVPGLLLFAAFAVERLFASVAAAKFSAAAVQCAALAAAALLVSIPQSDPAIWALATYNAGRQALDRGDIASAESQLELALRYAPNNAEANFALGNVRLAQGNGLAAEERYVAALRIDRRHKGALTNLGVLALDAENTETAEMYFRQVIAWEPRGAKGHFLLAKTLLKKGDREGAALEVNRAIELEPARPEFQKLRDEIAARE